MIEKLKQIARDIANFRVRLSHPFMDIQSRQDIIDESKRLEYVESNLRNAISEIESFYNDESK